MLPFATTWVDLERIVLSEISQIKKIESHFTCMWDVKETDRQTDGQGQQGHGYQRGRGLGSVKRVKGCPIYVMEGDEPLGGRHTGQ